MHVVRSAADCKRLHSILSGNPSQVRPKARFQVCIYYWITILGAEGAMHKVANIGVRHGSSLSVVRCTDLLFGWNLIPAINRWVIIRRPRGADSNCRGG